MRVCRVGKVLFGINIRLNRTCIIDKLVYALRKTVFFSMNLWYILYLRYILLNIKKIFRNISNFYVLVYKNKFIL